MGLAAGCGFPAAAENAITGVAVSLLYRPGKGLVPMIESLASAGRVEPHVQLPGTTSTPLAGASSPGRHVVIAAEPACPSSNSTATKTWTKRCFECPSVVCMPQIKS